jgi:transposase InsO family protein
VIDSGCTNHMTEEKHMFTSFEENDCPSDTIMFSDNSEGKVLRYGKIAITTDHSISKVLLVDSLDYNVLSVSQLCEMGYNCLFTNKGVTVFRRSDGSYAFSCILKGKLYLVDFNPEELELDKCLIAKTNMGWLWHRRLAHVGMRNLHKLQKEGHILGLMNAAFKKDRPCRACQVGKQVGAQYRAKNIMITIRPLEMLYMDLFGPIAYISFGGNKYGLVIIDDYSRFTWMLFLQDKSETQEVLKKFLKRAQNKFDAKIKRIRSENGTKFKNTEVEDYLDEEGIKHEFLAPYTPQQNWVVERKNRTLIEMTRTMFDEYKTSNWFGPRRSTWHVMLQTVFIFISFLRRNHMSSLPITNQMSLILESLEVSAMFFKRDLSLLNLLLKYMKNFCLDMTQTHACIVFSTRTPVMLKTHVTRCLMRLMAVK